MSGTFNFDRPEFHQNAPGSIGQQFNDYSSAPPDQELLAFVRATAQSLGALGLTPEALGQAQATLRTIELETNSPKPDQNVLVRLASGLRGILEGVAGQALAAVLLNSWHP